MSTDDLLRQILADPADAALRSVYADALIAAGDPRGELIAVELAGSMARRAELRAAYASSWWPQFPAHRIRTERGFVTAISTSATLIDALARLFDTELIETVELDDTGALAFGEPPWPGRVRHLALRGHNQHHQVDQLRGTALGEQLESLDVAGGIFNRPLLDGLPRCRRLAMAHCGVGRQITRVLRWSHVGALEELDVRSCNLDAHGLEELLALDLRSLRVLKLSGNRLGEAGTHVLSQRLRALPSLAHLELVDCGVRDITHTAITEREDLPAIVDLVGATLELVPTGAGRYGVLVDGVRRPLRFRSVLTEDGLPETVTVEWTERSDAPLEPLYQAIALGLQIKHTETGAVIQVSYDIDQEYGRAIATRETLEIAFVGERVDLEFERHIMT